MFSVEGKTLSDIEYFKGFILKLRDRDAAAWEILYYVLEKFLVYWLVIKIKDRNLARDLYHDIYITFYEIFPSCEFASFTKLKSFVLAIAHNKLRGYYHTRSARRNIVPIENAKEESECLPDNDLFRRLEQQNLIQFMFTHLTEVEQKILIFYFAKGLEVKEIAKKLGLSIENTWVIKHRTIAKLKIKILESNS